MSILQIQTPRVFEPLLKPSRYKGAYGGRGSGKSHFFAELGVERCLLRASSRGVCIREVQKSLKESAKRLIEDKIGTLGVGAHFDIQTDQIKTPGGGVILFQGMQDHTAESIKSLEGFDWAWVEEAQTLSARSLELLRPTIRARESEIWFSWNPKTRLDAVDLFMRGREPPQSSIIVKANYGDNPFFPAELEDERKHDFLHNRLRYGHIWLGEYEPAAVGAIWDMDTIHAYRRQAVPEFAERILVAVDPAISHEEMSNEHGIVVVAKDDERGYVLDDQSCRGEPIVWARRAVAAFDNWDADAVVIEINQGGDMVEHVLRSVRPNLPIIRVRASRGKHIRAEPISALYGLGKVSHVGHFPDLEAQMCQVTADGYQGEGSCDRVDALVWGMSKLFPQMIRRPDYEGEYEDTHARDTQRNPYTGY